MIHKKTRQRGVSIIEIVVSMVILFLVMMALAFVYPQGRKLTDTSDNRTKATEIARTILEEIQLIPFVNTAAAGDGVNLQTVSLTGINNNLTLANMASNDQLLRTLQWPYHHYATANANDWEDKIPILIAQNASALINDNPRGKTFCLLTAEDNQTDPHQIIPQGIRVTLPPHSDVTLGNREHILAVVTVTIVWTTFSREQREYPFVSLSSAFAGNKK